MIRRNNLTYEELNTYMPIGERILLTVLVLGCIIVGSCIDSIL